MTIDNEGRYEGRFKNGNYHGFGVFTWENGQRYEGDWKFNLMDGRGILVYSNKDTFEGDFFEGTKQGTGRFTSHKSLMVYDGPWMYGKQHGIGNIITKNGRSRKALYGDGELVQWMEEDLIDEDYQDLSSLG